MFMKLIWLFFVDISIIYDVALIPVIFVVSGHVYWLAYQSISFSLSLSDIK